MSKYNTLNVKLSNSELNNLKSGIKNGPEVTLNLTSSVIRNSNGGNTFPYNLLLTGKQVSKICKAFATCPSDNIKFSKTQLPKVIQVK